jgi:nucleoside-diphosphate-sugar epimerase
MIGVSFIQECLQNHTEVVALVRRDTKKLDRLPSSSLLSVYPCNLDELTSFSLPSAGAYDAFYHFAWGYTDKENRLNPDFQLMNVSTTQNAIKLASRLGCKKFIGAGSQAEYGKYNEPIHWSARVSPDSAYGIAKYAAGKLAAITAKKLGIDYIWTRIFSVYGYYDMPTTMIMSSIDSMLKGISPPLTACEQIWDYLFCEDAARAFYLLGEHGKTQTIYNVGSGIGKKLLDYVYSIRDAIDPNLTVNLGQVPYSKDQLMHLCADISNLTEDTGFLPKVSFEQGIKKTIDWYKNTVKV